ncbi:MAG: HAD-IIIA family hydrolase [Coriobacteriia bacterium]|nr:HAD-IIIA family hydrolase [Coriobacteriia bacterium]
MIKLFVMDVDGTLTDGKLFIGPSGELFKGFHSQDGMGITLLHKAGIHTAIITGRQSEIVEARAKELGIKEVFQKIKDKRPVLEKLVADLGLTMEEVAYIGDDTNDLGCLSIAGKAFIPANAVDAIRGHGFIGLSRSGGEGAVREAIDLVFGFEDKTSARETF